jgi:hypothetical protein
MLKEPTQPLDGPALSEEVYHLALERIKAVLGCTEPMNAPPQLQRAATATTTCLRRRLYRRPPSKPRRKLTKNTAASRCRRQSRATPRRATTTKATRRSRRAVTACGAKWPKPCEGCSASAFLQ